MFKKILVPLDGSKLAECALDYAEELAKNCTATELVLVSVTEKVVGTTKARESKELYQSSSSERVGTGSPGIAPLLTKGPQAMASKTYGASSGENLIIDGASGTTVIIGKKEKQAYKYLNRIAKKMKAKGLPAKTEVLIGDPAEKITKYAEDEDVEVVVMSSHGRSGPSRWAFGSVADKVFRASCIPVLMIRAPGCYPGI